MSGPEAVDEKITKLRRKERIAQLEVERVVDLCLEMSPMADLLDIGTGSGLFAEAFAARGVKVIGIDPDPDMIAAARGLVPAGSFHVAAAEALPFADRAVDACFMGMVLHETADSDRALLEARRVARNLVAVLEWPPPMPTDPPPPARRFDYEEIDRMNFTCIWVSHDLSILSNVSERLMIMYLGRTMELAPTRDLITDPLHPYAKALIAAVAIPDPTYRRPIPNIRGEVSQPIDPPPGCRFQTRCTEVMNVCAEVEPPLIEAKPRHFVACHLYRSANSESST